MNFQKEKERIKSKIRSYRLQKKRIFSSSSFQSHSIPMLHLISRIDNSIPVFFLDTGYHFPETLIFKDFVAKHFGLRVIPLRSSVSRILQRDNERKLYFNTDPDYCCYLNKILPMEQVLMENDVWINGVRKDQNPNRSSFNEEEDGPHNTIRYHPMLNWSSRDIWKYIKEYKLPKHPLEDNGFVSIGCEPCTQKFSHLTNNEREGRWKGLNKTECGLHTDLINQKDK